MSNVSFAQTKMANYVNRKAQEAKRYEQILNHIKTGLDATQVGKGGMVVTAGAISTAGAGIGAGTTIGTIAVGTGVVTGVVGLAALAYGGKKFYQSMTCFSGKDRAAQYPAIARALTQGDVFAKYKVILVNGPVITKNENTLKHLAYFLANPHQRVLVEEIGPEQDYRFYFDAPTNRPDLANRQVYADVDVSRKLILVRTPTMIRKGDAVDNYFIEPKGK